LLLSCPAKVAAIDRNRPRAVRVNRPYLPAVQFRQLVPDFAFAFSQFLRHVDLNLNVKIATLSGDSRQTPFSETKPLATLCAWRNFQAHLSFESGHEQFGAEHCLPGRDLYLVNQIAAIDRKIRVARKPDPQEQITAFSSAHTGFALAGQTNSLALANATRDFDLIVFDFVGACPTQ
jgi:hypothetical protein